MLLNCGVGKDSWVQEIKQVNPKEVSPKYSLEELMLKWKLQYFGHLIRRTDLLEKNLIGSFLLGKIEAGKDWGQEEKGMTEDEMLWWHHQLYGHEFEQTLGVDDGQGRLACCNPWGHKESDMTEQLNWTDKKLIVGEMRKFKLDNNNGGDNVLWL